MTHQSTSQTTTAAPPSAAVSPTTPRIALITGGSRGLGQATALHLARAGWDVVITYQSRADRAAATVDEIRSMGRKAMALQLDTADSARFRSFVAELRTALARTYDRETLDALVNNAGHGSHAPFLETTPEQFDLLMNVHLKGVFFLTQALVPLITDNGSIVNISSGLARFSLPGYAAYATMKGGIEVLTRYLAKELGGRGIRVNTLAPGAIETDFGGGAVRDNADLNRFVASVTALGRTGLPEDIGGAIETLLAPAGRWINGQRVEASGGMFV